MNAATVAILEEGGYKTLNDIIDLERDDFLKLPGITKEDADRLMATIDELTEDGGEETAATAEADAADSAPGEAPSKPAE